MVKKIEIHQLRKGMYLCGTDRKWIDLPFFRSNFLVKSDKDIATLREYCRFVDIDTRKGLDVVADPIQDTAELYSLLSAKPAMLDANEHLYTDCVTVFRECLVEARFGKLVDTAKIKHIVGRLANGVASDPKALIALTHRHRGDHDPLAAKSVNVAILALAFGHFIGVEECRLQTLGLGGLLHDIGLLMVPDSILAKTGTLNAAEWAEIRQHPQHGLNLLAHLPALPEQALRIVANHHEQLDGAGYPQGLPAEVIDESTRMVSIVSAYEAMVQERCHRQSLTPTAALKQLYDDPLSAFDPQLVVSFIETVGIYPDGCTLELQTGELAMVVRSNPDEQLRPQINVITNPQKQLLFQERLIDLASAENRDITVVRLLAGDDPVLELLKTFTERDRG